MKRSFNAFKSMKNTQVVNFSSHLGFTLAEVLITLGIIGVVAAMTMPTLINQTNGAQYKAAYKKALSSISQAITLNVALDGDDVGNVTDFRPILTGHMNYASIVDGAISSTEYNFQSVGRTGGATAPVAANTTIFLNDGTMFTFPTSISNCTEWDSAGCKGYIDVNGKKGPNKETVCKEGIDTAGGATCNVDQPTDIYPVSFFNQTIRPNSAAARAVLYGK